jgi:hypothetical protein
MRHPIVLTLTFVALFAACGGGRAVTSTASADGGVTGVVFVAGPVSGATVTAYALGDDASRGEALATATTDSTGAFALAMPTYSGHLLVASTGGSFPDPATGITVQVGGNELAATVVDFGPSSQAIVVVTPVSHLATALAGFHLKAGAPSIETALANAWTHLDSHFGGVSFADVIPTDLASAADGGVELTDASKAAVLLAFLSQEASDIAERAAVTPGATFSCVDLSLALADDLAADGFFDGIGVDGAIVLPRNVPVASLPPTATALSGDTVRTSLAISGVRYLDNPFDATGLAFSDLYPLLDELSSDSDPFLFRTPGVPFAKTAPTISFVATPPAYTSQSAFSFQVAVVSTASPVAQIYVREGTLAAMPANSLGNGVWQFDATLNLGPTVFQVWAVDLAGNSGENTSAALTFTIIYDPTPPLIVNDAAAVSYTDERGMTLAESAPGVPVTPPAYVFPAGSHPSAIAGGDAYKAATRLSWGPTAPTAVDLGAQDFVTVNVPYLVYTIPFDPAVDAPVQAVSFTIGCLANCGPGFAAANGTPLQDASALPALRYLVPLSVETAPGLASVPATATLAITLTASDAAGNTATSTPVQVFFHVIGPPLSWAEDTGYPGANDIHSAFPYKVSNGSYADAFGRGSAFAPDGLVRLVRYLVQNAEPVPVGFHVAAAQSPAWAALEEWDDVVDPVPSCISTYTAPDGTYLSSSYIFGYCQEGTVMSCANNGVAHLPGMASPYGCWGGSWPTSEKNAPVQVDSGGLAASGYQNPQPSGGETQPALLASNQYYVVPAATPASPGLLAVYLNRADGTRTIPLDWVDLSFGAPPEAPAYEIWKMDFWLYSYQTSCIDAYDLYHSDDYYTANRWRQELTAAQTQLSGSVSFSTQGLSGANAVGEPQLIAPSVDVTRTLSH